MTISNDILSSTLRILRDNEIDNLHRTTPFLQRIEELGGVIEEDGGQKIDHPVLLVEHSNVVELASGYEPVGLSTANPARTASYEWCDFTAPVVITKKEDLSNKGPRAIIRIAEFRLKSVMGMLKREAEKELIAGSSTVLTELETLNGFGTATGWFEELAFGSQANTVGGLVKSTYVTSWQNQVADAASNFATNGLRKMSNLHINAMTYAPEGDMDLVLASPLSYELYKDTLQSQERYIDEKAMLDGGRLSLAYSGARMYVEPNLGFTASTGDKVSMYFINSKLLNLYYDKDAKYELEDFAKVSGYASRSANVYVRMQIVASHLAAHGVLLNGEA